MKVILELNQKFGHGYQIHTFDPPMDSVYDAEPLSLADAGGYATWMLEEMNKQLGTSYDPHEVLSIARTGLEANKGEFLSRRFLRDIETKAFTLSKPVENLDYAVEENGEVTLSGRGVLLYAYTSWNDEGRNKEDKGAKFLHSYCRLLASKGYGGSASEIFQKLKAMNKQTGVHWCKATYARHVRSAEIMTLMNEL